jgi:sialic acid synthase SpsE
MNKRHRSFLIGSRKVGEGELPLIIAEVAQAHDGSLGTAHAFIDAVAESGVEAIKFQTHIASAESSSREPFRIKFSQQDATRYDYWKRMEFKPEQWQATRIDLFQFPIFGRSCGFTGESGNAMLEDRIW